MDVIVDSFLGVKFDFKVGAIFFSLFPPLPVVCLQILFKSLCNFLTFSTSGSGVSSNFILKFV